MTYRLIILSMAVTVCMAMHGVVEIVDINHHQFAPYLNDANKEDIVVGKIIVYLDNVVRPSLHKKTKSHKSEYTFFISDAVVKSQKVKQLVDIINNAANNLYSLKINHSDKDNVFSITFSFDDRIIDLQEWQLTSIKGQHGIEFRLINKSAIAVAEKYLSEKRATKVASAKKPKIVIDAGHGGIDTGACGGLGVYEKDLTLAISLLLKDILTSHNADVCLTRTDDSYLFLQERTLRVNTCNPDCVISIHANSSHNKSASGVEIYYPQIYKCDPVYSTTKENNKTVFDYFMYQYEQNSCFAEHVQKTLSSVGNGIKQRKIKTAASQFLLGVKAPVLLIEVGFISNDQERVLLLSPEYQKNLALSIATGILSFMQEG